MPHNGNFLISGAGIAGLTLAYWLAEAGFAPAIVDKRQDLCDEGYMIDFYGSGFDVAETMGLCEALHARHYPIEKLGFVNRDGQTMATLDIERLRLAAEIVSEGCLLARIQFDIPAEHRRQKYYQVTQVGGRPQPKRGEPWN